MKGMNGAFLNFHITLFQFEGKLLYRYGNIYREVMHMPRINVCRVTLDYQSNIMLATLLKMTLESAPTLIHPCPYKVEI